jgi:hypothetical protein
LGDGKGGFSARRDYYNGYNEPAGNVILADFDGDGKTDIILGTVTGDGFILIGSSISVLFGNGKGDFSAAPLSVAPALITRASDGILTSDFNGDGIPDLAVAGTLGVVARLGIGDGTFIPSYVSQPSLGPIVTGDFNNDGKSDLVAGSYINSSFEVLLGQGDGTFQTHTAVPASPNQVAFAVADFNGDGNQDLALLISQPGRQLADRKG